MLQQGVTVCSSGNKPIDMMGSTNMYSKIAEVVAADATRSISCDYLQTSLSGTSKNVLNIERMSPASVDSGFDSSFPSSPDCSLDSSAVGVEMTKCCKDSNFKQRHQTAAALTVVPQCPLSICQPSCSSLSPPISRTSSGVSTFSTVSLISSDTKTDENFCLDACLLEKTASLTSLSSSLQLAVDVPINEDSRVSSTARLGNDTKSLAGCSTAPSCSGSSASEINEIKLRVRCRWKSCTERFSCDNDLYDHVVKDHLELLRPSAYLGGNNSNSGNSGGGSQSQTTGRLKSLMCQWGNCKMGLSRGDFQKQFIWLEEHFTTRHAGKAQPYMCLIEGCSSRFTLKRSLEEHLRTGHEKVKAKRPHNEEGELTRIKSCYQWTPIPYYIPSEKNDFLDLATEEWIVMRLRQYERTNNACFIPREPATPRGGAAYRKRRRILTFAIESSQITPKVVSDAMELADAKSLIKSAFISGKNCKNSVERTITDSS
uniref:C2H2-type domain-containing protein n=1 Tax=Elaeophora elaphi TaxID=1147741 RepID=A0A0R3RHQ7_9BILA